MIVPSAIIVAVVLLLGIFFIFPNKGVDVYTSPQEVQKVDTVDNINSGIFDGHSVLFWRTLAVAAGAGIILLLVIILLIVHFRKKKLAMEGSEISKNPIVEKPVSEKSIAEKPDFIEEKPVIEADNFNVVDSETEKISKINNFILEGEGFLGSGRKDLAVAKYQEVSTIYGTLKRKNSEVYQKILEFHKKLAGI